MILNDKNIEHFLEIGSLIIEPRPEIVQPTSVDLHLSRNVINDVNEEITMREHAGYRLRPGEFILASTVEWVELPPWLVGILMGKSTLARMGVQVEAAGYVDPGWKGRLTLEIKNLSEVNNVVLFAGMKICQIRFEQCAAPKHLYGDPALRSHYQHSSSTLTGDPSGLYVPIDRSDPDLE